MIDLDKPIHICTPRTILMEMLKDKQNLATFKHLIQGEVITVNHDMGNFMMTYDEVQQFLAVCRLRGGAMTGHYDRDIHFEARSDGFGPF